MNRYWLHHFALVNIISTTTKRELKLLTELLSNMVFFSGMNCKQKRLKVPKDVQITVRKAPQLSRTVQFTAHSLDVGTL